MWQLTPILDERATAGLGLTRCHLHRARDRQAQPAASSPATAAQARALRRMRHRLLIRGRVAVEPADDVDCQANHTTCRARTPPRKHWQGLRAQRFRPWRRALAAARCARQVTRTAQHEQLRLACRAAPAPDAPLAALGFNGAIVAHHAAASTGFALIVAGGLFLMGGLLQINPIWLYGPYDPFTIISGAQADFSVLWLQGAPRLMSSWEIRAFGYTIPNPFFPGILLPALMFGTLFAWPWLEALLTGDRRTHHLLDRPRDRPVRIAIGVGAFTFVAQLLIAGADDVIAVEAGWSIVAFRTVERVLLFVLPVVTGLLAYRIASDLPSWDQCPVEDQEPQEPAAADDAPDSLAPEGCRLLRAGMLAAAAGALAHRLRNRR